MLDELDSAITKDLILIKDPYFIKEALQVQKDDDGKVSITGKDSVAANAIAWQMRKYGIVNKNKKLVYEF